MDCAQGKDVQGKDLDVQGKYVQGKDLCVQGKDLQARELASRHSHLSMLKYAGERLHSRLHYARKNTSQSAITTLLASIYSEAGLVLSG
jgi:hypothetical protein